MKTKTKNILIIFLFSVYVFLLFSSFYININGYKISFILLLGFILVIAFFFFYINSNKEKGNTYNYNFRFLSENFFKFILLTLMFIAVFIPPITTNNLLINWEYVLPFNYLRSIIFILCCAFLPGSNLYSLFFPNDEISKKFSIEPFFVKITLYPLISFGFIGVSVIILDQIGLFKEFISFFLILMIIILFIIDILFQMIRSKHLEIGITRRTISKNTFYILLFAMAVLTISIGFQYGLLYIPSGDPWDGIKYANLIGINGGSFLSTGYYPKFWGYISFGFSALTGLPLINVNTLLAPFSYLFVTSVYIFMKALLFNFKEKFAVLSTILVIIFSGLFSNPLISRLIFVSEFYFIYKSYSYFLFFLSISLFLIVMNNKDTNNSEIKQFWKTSDIKFIILGSLLLFLSFMTYVLPSLIGIIFLLFYSLLSKKIDKEYNFRFFLFFVFFTIIFFLFFDILLNFYLSYMVVRLIPYFFNFEFFSILKNIKTPYIITYPLFLVLLLILYCLYFIILKNLKKVKKTEPRVNVQVAFIFKIIFLLFIIFLIIEFFLIFLEEFIFNIDISNEFFFFLYLERIVLNLGFIGILGVLFSYYCYKKSKNLFLILLSWAIFSFSFAFLIIFIENITNFNLPPKDISEENIFMMDYWFNRIWFYSIPSLCVFSSIGLFELVSRLRKYKILQQYKFLKLISKNIISSSLIFFSFTGIIFSGIIYSNANFRYSKDQILTLDWISENIPIRSNVLVGDNFFMGVGVDSITFVGQYFFYDIFETEFNETQCIQKIEYLKNETIQYVVISQFFISYYLNKSDFTNHFLLPNFYSVPLYKNGDLSVHYAPYFD